MPFLITFGLSSTSLNLKNISLALYPVPNTYPLESIIHLLNNWGQQYFSVLSFDSPFIRPITESVILAFRFIQTFDCLARRGTMVVHGGASGPPDPLNVDMLAKGSSYVTFGHFLHFVEDPAELNRELTSYFLG